jgi:N utilization substance protein A
LLGWKIDIKSEEEKRQEVEQQMADMQPQTLTPLDKVPGLGEGLVEKLGAAGVTTVEALADMTPEQLEAIEGIGPKTVEKISLAVNNYFASLESGTPVEVVAEAEIMAEGETLAEPSGNPDDITAEIPVAVEEAAGNKEPAVEDAERQTVADEHENGEPASEAESTSETRE